MKKITQKLVIGISSIVLLLALIIAVVFMTQYRNILLENKKINLLEKAEQIADFVAITPSIDANEYVDVLNKMTDTQIWIARIDRNQIIMKGSVVDSPNLKQRVIKDIEKLIENNTSSIVSFSYGDFFKNKCITVIRPIVISGQTQGAIFMHSDINDILKKYDRLIVVILMTILFGICLSIILGVLYSYRFTKPIDKMKTVAKDISAGNYGIKTGIVQDDEIGELAICLDDMSVELEKYITDIRRLEESAKELVANVSHEFKTPLTLIRGNIENMQDGTVEPTYEAYERIINHTKYLERLVNEILDLGKYQTGKVTLKKELLDLNQLLSDITRDMSSISEVKNIKLVYDNKNDSPKIVNLDYLKMKQLITIFIDNAIKYSHNNTEVKVILDGTKITILDNGIGMTEEQKEKMFDRFYQVSPNKNGNGLGLCIAKYIIDLHGLDVKVETEIDKGTKIIIDCDCNEKTT